jgi:hypothetical protein
VLAATRSNLASPERVGRIVDLTKQWLYMGTTSLPVLPLDELLSDIDSLHLDLPSTRKHVFELPLLEQSVLAALVRDRQPRLIFEFGTYTGSTTLTLARSSPPDGVIHTVDLPWAASKPAEDPIGAAFRDENEFSKKIVQHRCNLRDFDPSPWRSEADLVFIDASHQLDDVVHDSRRALELLAPSGVIVWDDYQPAQPGVVLALEQLHREVPISRIEGTRLAIYKPEPRSRDLPPPSLRSRPRHPTRP